MERSQSERAADCPRLGEEMVVFPPVMATIVSLYIRNTHIGFCLAKHSPPSRRYTGSESQTSFGDYGKP